MLDKLVNFFLHMWMSDALRPFQGHDMHLGGKDVVQYHELSKMNRRISIIR